MKHITLILFIIVTTIAFCLGRYEQCQCYLLMALLYNTIWNDLNKKGKKGD